MVATRSSPRKKQVEPIEPEIEQELDDDVAPEDVTVPIDSNTGSRGKQFPPPDNNPPKPFILPKDASKEARIVTLPEPSRGQLSRFFSCPEKGLYEFTKVAAPRGELRSTLLAPTDREKAAEASNAREGSIPQGYIAESSDIFIATPMDPVFFLVPILAPASAKNQKRLFVTLDDHIEQTSTHFQKLLRQNGYRKLFEARLDCICETVEAGDDSMYRLSTDKLASVLVSKARRMVKQGLPPSMEERFIREALQAPILNIKRKDTIVSQTTTAEGSQAGAPADDSQIPSEVSTQKADTQSSTPSQISATTSMTSITISQDDILPDAPPSTNEASEEVRHLLRLRTALEYMQTCYIPPHIVSMLSTPINVLIDFTPLDTHLKHLASLHEEARALRALSDNITRKRGLDDDEAAEERAEKKRKKEQEEKRKKTESNALKALKKADTSGMKKLSSFFTKAPKKKA
jgi:hypothetical protein